MSWFLISLFLPYRLQHHFYMDVAYFLRCFALPSSHPESIHPCLLHACYLAACNLVGGRWAAYEPYFLERSRFFLNQALMLADRIPHFLWASILLGYYFGKARRLEESFAVVSAASRLAVACGFCTSGENPPLGTVGLLSPPTNKAEAIDRFWLFHAIYMGDQALPALFPFPETLGCDKESGLATGDVSKNDSWFKIPMIEAEDLSGFWKSDVHLRASAMHIFQRVHKFAISVIGNGFPSNNTTYNTLKAEIQHFDERVLPVSSKKVLEYPEGAPLFNPYVLITHITLLGSGLILYSLRAREDTSARSEMVSCAVAIGTICRSLQRDQQLHSIQCSLFSMLHMMNAARIFAQELQGSKAQENDRLSASYCCSLECLLDTMDAVTLTYTAWSDTPASLKNPLTAAVDAMLV
ncbi:hypothetical protein DL93DRAFT_2158106 [Clavulina sp. PMI_390]|nr:hypothetical protein DL93DRAFT_2158106 [Clavulina sp. PMI_390]